MKLLIYAHSFAPQIGGVETYAMLLAQGLATRDASPPVQVLLATQSPRAAFDDTALPFTVVRRPGLLRLANLIRRSDVIHLAGPVLTPLFLAVLLRKPFVVEHHGYQANCPNGLLLYEPTKSPCPGHYMQHHYRECLRCNAAEAGWFTSLRWLLLTGPRRWFCARANVNVGVSNHVISRVQLPHPKVIYHGIPAPPVDAAARGAQSISPRSGSVAPLSIAYVGRLVHEKGVTTLLETARLLAGEGRRFTLKIVGDGPQRPALELVAREITGDSAAILFTGLLQGDALHAALQDVAVVVIPTIMEETAGMAVIEQMMRGGPVIVSDTGGLAEVAGDGGLKFPVGESAALADCLRRLMDKPSLLSELAARAKNRADTLFTQARMVDDHARMFESLVRNA